MHQHTIPQPLSAAPSPEDAAACALPADARILVVKAAGLGDVLLALPALRALRHSYPHARIELLTTPQAAALLRDSPLVDRVLSVDKVPFDNPIGMLRALWHVLALAGLARQINAASYDAVLLLHHLTLPFGRLKYRLLLAATHPARAYGLDNGHGAFLDVRVPDAGFGARHEAEYGLDVARAAGAAVPPLLAGPCLADLGWDDLEPGVTATNVAGGVDGAPLIALHVGSGTYSIARRWSLERFIALARSLHHEVGARIALIGGGDERELVAEARQALGEGTHWVLPPLTDTTPRATAALLARCDLCIGNDAFPMHLAAAAGTPVLAIFGPSNAQAWRPRPRDAGCVAEVVTRDLACSPCFYRGHRLGTPQGCPPRLCLEELPVAMVLSAALRLLQRDRVNATPPA